MRFDRAEPDAEASSNLFVAHPSRAKCADAPLPSCQVDDHGSALRPGRYRSLDRRAQSAFCACEHLGPIGEVLLKDLLLLASGF
jgi:hypothetical protein